MGTARTKPTDVIYLPARDITEMVQALASALDMGYRGQIQAYLDVAQQPVWKLELNGPQGVKPVDVNLGDVIVLDNTSLRTMTTDEFAQGYDLLDDVVVEPK